MTLKLRNPCLFELRVLVCFIHQFPFLDGFSHIDWSYWMERLKNCHVEYYDKKPFSSCLIYLIDEWFISLFGRFQIRFPCQIKFSYCCSFKTSPFEIIQLVYSFINLMLEFIVQHIILHVTHWRKMGKTFGFSRLGLPKYLC